MEAFPRDEIRCSLAAEVLRSWGVLQLRAMGISMLPTLWPGDLLTIHALSLDQIEPGEIVLYMRRGRFFIHRTVSKDLTSDGGFLVTRGDCMPSDDAAVGRGELLGKVTEVRRAGSVFLPGRTLTGFRRLLAWLFCHGSFFRRAGLRLMTHPHRSNAEVEATFVEQRSD